MAQEHDLKPVRLGLIGCGGIVRQSHVPALLSIPALVEIAAVADPVSDNRAQVGRVAGVPQSRWYADYQEMLDQAEIDAVSIATPHHLHAAPAIHSAQAGKAVICEKPMGTTLDEADTILKAVNRHRVAYSVVHNYLFAPAMRSALNLLDDGSMGRPLFGRAQSLYNKAAELPTTEWRNRSEMGGGAINDTAYHEIYLIQALVGAPVRYVEARVQTRYYPFEVDDLAVLLLEHENGVVSTVSTSWCIPDPVLPAFCEVHTDQGSLRVHNRGRHLQRFWRTERQWADVDVPELSQIAPEDLRWAGHAGYFAATFGALAQGQSPPVTGQQARHNLAIIAAARKASQERRAVEVGSLN